MIRPDFREFRNSTVIIKDDSNLCHSAKGSPRYFNSQDKVSHSAEGSSWKDHKYIKKIDGVYYYPIGYKDGRTVDELKSVDNKNKESEINEVKKNFDQYLAKRGIDWRTLPKEEVDQMQRDIIKQLESGKETGTDEKTSDDLAKDVISGKLGNGEDRKKLLGEKYEEVQKRVNELMKGSTGSKKIPTDKLTKSNYSNIAEEAAKKAVELVNAHRNKKNK